MKKSEVRQLAKEKGLDEVAEKKDSTGVCFVGESFEVRKFLREKMGEKKGSILNLEGEKIGEHQGVWFYTVGQRGGLNIAAKCSDSKPLYVVSKNIDKNELIVGFEENLYTDEFSVLKMNYLVEKSDWEEAKKRGIWVRIRHTGELIKINKIDEKGEELVVFLEKKVKGINEGQFAVFYGDEMKLEDGGKTRICSGGVS